VIYALLTCDDFAVHCGSFAFVCGFVCVRLWVRLRSFAVRLRLCLSLL
jgi:hypothetical protein